MPIFTPPSPALQKAWWKETIVYQIYPRSFKDSNDDGIGDLNGITEKLDYLHGLGIETLWLNPIFASPNTDNGYDISDYRQIMPDFGTMEDFDRLLKETHARGMRLLLDLVLNHTSDQHPWFREARTSRENPYYDYYLWWPEEQGHPPYRKSHFDEKGDAWCYNAPTRSYYLHYFARQQPDLNWQSPKVRAEIYDILRFWLDKGVDGFRLDSIPYIAKDTSFPEIDLRKYPDVFPYYSLGPHLHDYLHEMNREVFSRYDCTTVGEGSKTAPEEGWKFIAPERQELDMLYHFGAADIRNETEADDPATGIPYSLLALKRMYAEWDAAVGDGWPTIYLGNHDQPRTVSAFGDDRPQWRVRSAKMLATCLHMMEGTPYIYQGEELGMTNCPFQSLDEFRDIDSLNGYRRWVTDGPLTHDEFFPYLLFKSRDNARTPMQWDDSPNAGFTRGTPWIRVNPNYTEVNAAAAMADPDSTFYYFQKLIRLRKTHPVIVHGRYELLEKDDPALFIYTRTLDDAQLLVMCNFKEQTRKWTMPAGFAGAQVLISNTGRTQQAEQTITLQPYEALVLLK